MEHNSDLTQRQMTIPPMIWFLGIGLVLALTALFVFNVAVSTVAYYGLFAFFIGSHFFMHGSHGGHGGSGSHQHAGPVSNAAESEQPDANQHPGHTGGCH
jgi:hypothetical protein